MVTDDPLGLHLCACHGCRQHPRSLIARNHRAIGRLVRAADERMRRLLAGIFAHQLGRGGLSQVARITGLDRKTIAKGQRELRRGVAPLARCRLRAVGAGRKRVEEQHPGSSGPCKSSCATTRLAIRSPA